jgi:membrane protease YdiL (CAAX protease family)
MSSIDPTTSGARDAQDVRDARTGGGSVVWFAVVALGISWGVWLSIVASSRGLLPVRVPVGLSSLGTLGPAAAAVILAAATGGSVGLRALLGRAIRWRVAARWYLAAALGPLAIGLVAVAAYAVAAGVLPPLPAPLPEQFASAGASTVAAYAVVLTVFVAAALGEELGWRGYALPGLQRRYGGLAASLLLGGLWTVWHLPLFWLPGAVQSHLPIGWYLASVLSVSVLYTWLFNRTGGSVLLAGLFHASFNVANLLVPVLPSVTGDALSYRLHVVVIAAAAILVTAASGRDLGRPRRTRGGSTIKTREHPRGNGQAERASVERQ